MSNREYAGGVDAAFYKAPARPKESESLDMFAADAVAPPVAPGSATSQLAADAIDGPFQRQSWRRIMLALAAATRPLSREELSARTEIKESSLCARLHELRPTWVRPVDGVCTSGAGVAVNGYELTDAGRERVRRAQQVVRP